MTPRSWRSPARRHASLRLEPLEDRSLLDVGAAVMGPQLFVTMKGGQTQTVPVTPDTNINFLQETWKARPDVQSVARHEVFVSAIPNDPSFNQLWGLHNTGQAGGRADADIDAPEAWDVYTGGTNKVVAVIDTGIDYTHPDLYKNIWVNQGEIPNSWLAGPGLSQTVFRSQVQDTDADGLLTFWDLNDPANAGLVNAHPNSGGRIDAAALLRPISQGGWQDGIDGSDGGSFIDDLVGWDFYNNDNNPFDDNSHGTHVAGTIGAIGNNGVGVAGVNWKAQIAAIKFLGGSGGGSLQGGADSVNYAVALGIPISNNSWGGGGFYAPLNTALNAAQAAGHVFVAAAGNSSNNNDVNPNYPSNYPQNNIVAVASTTRTEGISSFSSYGPTTVDLGAPGSSILSTVPNNSYSSYSGTSMATPHVAGAITLVWNRFPTLTYSQVISRILTTVDATASMNGRVATGGRLNLAAAIGFTPPPADTTGARVTAAVANGSQSATSVRVTFNEAINPGSFTAGDVTLTAPNGSGINITGVTAVNGSGNTQFDVTFASVSAAGDYTIAIGPTVNDAAGNPMDQNTNGVNGENPGDVYTGTFTLTPPPPDTAGAQVLSAVANGTTSVSSLRVTFSEAITAGSFGLGDVALSGPGGTVTITGVSAVGGTGNTQFDVSFAAQTTPGAYSFRVGPQILDAAGNAMNQDGDGTNGEDPADAYAGSFEVQAAPERQRFTNTRAVRIRDFNTTISTINVPNNLTISDLDVELNIRHTYDGDLMIYLRSPGGQYATLSNFRGGSGNNFTGTTFDDEAGTAVGAGQAPFTGSFRPDTELAVFDGTNARGNWTLFVVDYYAGDQGWLDNWTLSIATGGGGNRIRAFDVGSDAGQPAVAAGEAATVPVAGVATTPLGTFFSEERTWSRREEQPVTVHARAVTSVEEATPAKQPSRKEVIGQGDAKAKPVRFEI